MAVNRMQLPEFLAGRNDPGFRNLAVTLADPILNRTAFSYLLALVQEGHIGLATSHLVENIHFRGRVLASLTRTEARQTEVYYMPRIGW